MSKTELRKRLSEFAADHPMPGLKQKTRRERFIAVLIDSGKKLRALRMKRFSGHTDPSRKSFQPLQAIAEHFKEGERDEAFWLAFLCIHFGWVGRAGDTSDTVRLFYGKFGVGIWNWNTVVQSPAAVREWMATLSNGELKQLKFGNHRKYETNSPHSPVGTAAVIASFVAWVNRNGDGSAWQAFNSVRKTAPAPVTAFDHLYESLSQVTRFGRTARFDFLCLLGNLGIFEVTPPHCYLRNSTRPKAGALLLVSGKKKGALTPHIDKTIQHLRTHLGVPVEAFEDALCNW